MADRVSPAKPNRPRSEEKAGRAGKPKIVMIYRPVKREISRDLYYPTDRYRLSQPLFPDPGSLKVAEPS